MQIRLAPDKGVPTNGYHWSLGVQESDQDISGPIAHLA